MPTLDTIRLDVYSFEGKVKGVTGTFTFRDRTKQLSPGTSFKTYSACQDADSLSTKQEKAFAKLAGRANEKVTLFWKYHGQAYKKKITVGVPDVSGGIGPSCDELEGSG